MTSTKFRHFLIFSGADGISRSATLASAERALDADGDVGGVWRRHSMRSQTRGSSMVVIPSWSVSTSWSIHRQAPFRSVWLSLLCWPRPSHFDPLSHPAAGSTVVSRDLLLKKLIHHKVHQKQSNLLILFSGILQPLHSFFAFVPLDLIHSV